MTNIETNVKTKLMNWGEYAKLEHSLPYKFILENRDVSVFYFGERHSFDPNDEQWKEEELFWRDFLEKTKTKKRIVFVEGGIRKIEKTAEMGILEQGGMGYVTYLASLEGIETFSPEPSEKHERDELEKRFSKEAIQYYYFARMVYQWGKKNDPKPNFTEYINSFLEADKKESGWTEFNFSLENMLKIHEGLFKSRFSENDTDFFYKISNPVDNFSEINAVSEASSEVRDLFIVSEIERYIKEGYSIFLQYGASHAVVQEAVLRELFK
jgi:hypothetical protein